MCDYRGGEVLDETRMAATHADNELTNKINNKFEIVLEKDCPTLKIFYSSKQKKVRYYSFSELKWDFEQFSVIYPDLQ